MTQTLCFGLNVGLIGCGAIGGTLAQSIIEGKAGDVKLVAICDIDKQKIERLNIQLGLSNLLVTTSYDEIIYSKNIELVIEAASQNVVEAISERVLNAGKNMLIMSIGALKDKDLLFRLVNIAKRKKVKLYLPSGAICGLDGVKAASVERIARVEITTTKHPRGLDGAPYILENNIDLNDLTMPMLVYEGTAKEAAKGFPKNVNVAVALSLAGIGVEKTMVKIIADPKASRTQHEVRVVGDFGELYTKVNNIIHPENPKTSYLAALAAIRTLRKIFDPIQVGT